MPMSSLTPIQLTGVRYGTTVDAGAFETTDDSAISPSSKRRTATPRTKERERDSGRRRRTAHMPAPLSRGSRRDRARQTSIEREPEPVSEAVDVESSRRGASSHTKKRSKQAAQGSLPARIVAWFGARPARIYVLAAIGLAVMVAISLYKPVRDYYTAMRDHEVLEARYEELSTYNEELLHDINYLQSSEGIEDEARRHGYVMPGETGVAVEGLGEDGLLAGDDAPSEVQEGPWYQRVLDFIFGYTPSEW
jgi:cell division protein FtsB